MKVQELLSLVQRSGIELTVENDQLRFRAPKGAMTPDLRDEIALNKPALIEALRVLSPRIPARPSTIPPIARNEWIPLSHAQERLWFLGNLEPDSPFYNVTAAQQLSGELNRDALHRTFTEIVRRHEALRVSFREADGETAQHISPPEDVSMEFCDLFSLPESGHEMEIQRQIHEAIVTPFDLRKGPLFRFRLIRQNPTQHVLVYTIHHIVSDGWSMVVFRRELAALYAAFCEGRPSPLPELSIQYADFASWQRDWLKNGRMASQLEYWKKQLSGIPSAIQLSVAKPRPAEKSHQGSVERHLIPGTTLDRLKQLSRDEGSTLFMVLIAAFSALLSRYSDEDDIVLGSPIANRHLTEIEPLIGFFVNTLVLRTNCAGNPSFRDLLKEVRKAALGAYENQDVPFESLVQELRPARSASHSPLFQILFALDTFSQTQPEVAGLEIKQLPVNQGTARFDISLNASVTPEGLLCRTEYSTDLFDRDAIRQLLRSFQVVLESIIENPDRTIDQIPILSELERSQVLETSCGPNEPAAYAMSIHELFENRVREIPDTAAIVFEGRMFTFRELDERANKLARFLKKQGAGPEKLIGISVERSPEMIVALLGVHKAGAAFVPIDPTYPRDRIAHILSDAAPVLLLTQDSLAATFPPHKAPTIRLDGDWPTIDTESTEPLLEPTRPDQLAYSIYTSGSTGKPKGVLLEHRGLSNVICVEAHEFGFLPGRRVLQTASFSFDAAVSEICMALVGGSTLYLARHETITSPEALTEYLRDNAIDVMLLTPALLELLDPEATPDVKSVISAGEACRWEVALKWSKGRSFINAYGPSESTIGPTYYRVNGQVPGTFTVPVGRPIANTEVYILDEHLEPLPAGYPGEIYIGGVGVARGYNHRPDLTAEKFITHPFSYDPNARLYRTGDLARYLSDGNIEYLGRLDHQVKLRGFRIELGEIESALSEHALINQAIVVAREDTGGNKRLVAYFTTNGGIPEAHELNEHLKDSLPDFMVPAAYVPLDAFPLTPNGKVDRSALPNPAGASLQASRDYVPPSTTLQSQIAEVWKEMLSVDRVGIHDNFFELGGHSLLAMRTVARIRTALSHDVPLRWLFSHPTVESLARQIAENTSAGTDDEVQAADRELDLPLSSEEQRLWYVHNTTVDHATYNTPWARRFRGILDLERLQRSLDAIAGRHEILRTAYTLRNGTICRLIEEACALPITTIDLSSATDSELEGKLLDYLGTEARRPFDLQKPPLVRVSYVKLGTDDHAIVLVAHHIISDEWTMRLLAQELTAVYSNDGQLAGSSLEPIRFQYADYAAWQQRRIDSMDAGRSYWKAQLAEVPADRILPFDKKRPAQPTGAGQRYSFEIPVSTAREIEKFGRESNSTPFVVWLTAYSLFLHRLCNKSDIVIGTPISNRRRSEFQSLLGFFLNTLPIRSRMDPETNFPTFIQQTKDVTLDSFEHGELPLDHIVRTVPGTDSAFVNALFSIMFVHLDVPADDWVIEGATSEELPVPTSSAKSDLTLFLQTHRDGSIAASFEFNSDVFEEKTIREFGDRFLKLCDSIVSDAELAVSRLSILPENERVQLTEKWQGVNTGYPAQTTIHELFSAQAETFGEKPALVCGDQELTYAELEAQSDALRDTLLLAGIKPGEPVAVHIGRGLDFVVSILAVLKSGGSYLPLEVGAPADRLRHVVTDARCRIFITMGPLPESVRTADSIVIDAGSERNSTVLDSTKEIESHVTAHSPAYVMFTSGSTGRPKGAVIPHRAVVRLVCGQSYVPFDSSQRTLFLASPAFDAATFEIWGPLLNGGTCVVFPNKWPDLEDLEHTIREKNVSCVWLTAGLFNQIIDHRPTVLNTVRYAITGGEALSVSHVESALQLLPNLSLVNGYGPTESTTFACAHPISRNEVIGSSVPIGRPIANTSCFILDSCMEPVPIGVTGELYIGGDGLADGYLNQPELTAEKFITSPFGNDPADRLYRTGDLCRWLHNGNIEFLGRVDDQLKIRGFRIEPGEIENSLCTHEGVDNASVVAIKGRAAGTLDLAAFVVTNELNPAPQDLKTHLEVRLPAYMIPTHFSFVDNLPLTPNGKVDRKKLLANAQFECSFSAKTRIAPRNEIESKLAGIWGTILQNDNIGVTDDFFQSGGHSLLAVRLIAEIDKSFHRRLPIAAIFAAPTIQKLARHLGGEGTTHETGVQLLRGDGDGAPLFHIPSIAGYEFLPEAIAKRIRGERKYFDGLQYSGLDGDDAPAEAVEEIASCLVKQIRSISPHGPYCLSGFCFGGLVAYEVAQQLTAQGETVSGLSMWDSFPPGAWRFKGFLSRVRATLSRIRIKKKLENCSFASACLAYFRERRSERRETRKSSVQKAAASAFGVRELKVREANTLARGIYKPKPYDGAVMTVTSSVDEMVFEYVPDNGWRNLLSGTWETLHVNCDHRELIQEPFVRNVAHRVSAFLKKCDSSTDPSRQSISDR